MAQEPLNDLLDELTRSGLVAPGQLDAATIDQSGEKPSTRPSLTAALVEKRILTPYQASQVLEGRADECVIAGRYRVLDKLGQGGMGAVFKAHDIQLDRDVAVKVLPSHCLNDADAVTRFQREARALAKLSHPNIIQAHDNGEDKGRHFLVMEYVDGASLSAILREQGAMPPTLAADVVYQAALGLQHAHEKGLIHRDLKPANLLLSRGAPLAPKSAEGKPSASVATVAYTPPAVGKGVVKILDLGLDPRFVQDHVGDSQLTQEGMGVGTPDYMAPEQFRDALHADVRTDIYGLGCTLYHLIAGTVPFPGSSFSEKAKAHAKMEAIPLEERCPEVPGGLAFVVSKMMAKHPADRFQSAAEAAEALAPYVAGASHSMIMLRQTMRFHAGQLTMKAPRNRRWLIDTGIGIAAALLVGLGFLAYQHWFDGGSPKNPDIAVNPQSTEPPGTQPAEPEKPKVVAIENGLTVAKDGTGQYETIAEALKNIQPKQTIRVLDKATYPESLAISRPLQHAGITLESTDGATLDFPAKTNIGILISNVTDVKISGFRLRGDVATAVVIFGKSAGAVLERLDGDMSRENSRFAVSVEGVAAADHEPPIIVRDCHFRNAGSVGLRISGYEEYHTPQLSRRICLFDNRIEGSETGILVVGMVQQVVVAGNRIWDCEFAALQMENIMEGSGDILLFNNSALHCGSGLRLWDRSVVGKNIQVRNNLFLKSIKADFVYLDSGGDPEKFKGPGNSEALLKVWQLSHNWRETSKPSGTSIEDRGWVPPVAQDVAKPEITEVGVKPGEADFLRPAKESPLVNGGAGGDLPTYVGAVAPEGGEQWNWQWTWDAQVNKLITVSKNKEDGGRFQTIGAAMRVVRIGMTIRVIDDREYEEAVVINNRGLQAGITLEGTGKTVLIPPNQGVGVLVHHVPGVTIRNLQLRSDGKAHYLAVVAGKSPGVRLRQLEFEPGGGSAAVSVSLEGLNVANEEEPVVIQGCVFRGGEVAVRCAGLLDYKSPPVKCGGIRLVENSMYDVRRALTLFGWLYDIHIVGNRICGSSMYGLQLEKLAEASRNILIANNTFLACNAAFRVWDDAVKGDQIAFLNNLHLQTSGPDMIYIDSGGDQVKPRGPGNSDELLKRWHVAYNWREVKPPTGDSLFEKSWIPRALKDTLADEIPVMARGLDQADFLRPKEDSPLAKDGAGKDDLTLPIYVGAVPPKDVPTWNWNHTWDMRVRKLFTVSKKAENGGAFRTIGAALKAVREKGSTLRVLDAESYPEAMNFADATRFAGLKLEAPQRAKLELTAAFDIVCLIENVPNVSMSGFRFERTGGKAEGYFVKITGRSPGAVIRDLEMSAADQLYAIWADNVRVEDHEEPVQIRNCVVQGPKPFARCFAIGWVGPSKADEAAKPARGVLICDNRINEVLQGIIVQGKVRDVLVAGNLCRHCKQVAVEFKDILPGTGNVLAVNNTAFDCDCGLRVWDVAPHKKYEKDQAYLGNNLFHRAVQADMAVVLDPGDGSANYSEGNAGELWKTWKIGNNWRDQSGLLKHLIAVMATGDKKLDPADLISRDEKNPDFLRPKPDSPLASEGAGKDDATLPKYVGAVPPKGVEPWDWEKTWKEKTKQKP